MLQKLYRSRSLAIARKEFLHIIRDRRTLLLTFALPVVMLVLYAYALTFDIRNIPMAVRDLDNSPMTRQITRKFVSSGYFDLVGYVSNFKEEEKFFLSGKIKMALNFGPGFAGRVNSGRGADLQIVVDGSDSNTSLMAVSYVNTILQDYSKDILLKYYSRSQMTPKGQLLPIEAHPRIWYNPELKSMNFLVPGIIAMVLMILSALITSLSIVSEKTRGTMEQLIATSIRPMEIMAGKMMPYVLIGLCDVLLCVLVSVLFFKVPIRGSVFLLLLESIIFIFGSLGLGLFISTIAKKQENAIIMGAMTTMLPSILLSGFVFPIESMPRIIQLTTYFVPARYFLTILRGIFLKGIGIEYLWFDTLLLTAFGVLMIVLAARQFKKRLD